MAVGVNVGGKVGVSVGVAVAVGEGVGVSGMISFVAARQAKTEKSNTVIQRNLI